ncbi:MAG: hypothetical protein IPJ98_11420 [Bryobacterales bacterium]|nr:hypothetical protein [Bryobacterales bacterium]
MIKAGNAHWLLHDVKNRGITAWLLSALLTAFYLVLYFTEWFTPPARAIGLDSKWTLYGLLYTLAVTAGGLWVIRKYRHNRYQIVRTSVVIFVQATFAFSIPPPAQVPPPTRVLLQLPVALEDGLPHAVLHLLPAAALHPL